MALGLQRFAKQMCPVMPACVAREANSSRASDTVPIVIGNALGQLEKKARVMAVRMTGGNGRGPVRPKARRA
jgi:hypothetical protein